MSKEKSDVSTIPTCADTYNFFSDLGGQEVKIIMVGLAYGILTGISQGDFNRLQLVQNRLARIATNTPRIERISPILASLYRL